MMNFGFSQMQLWQPFLEGDKRSFGEVSSVTVQLKNKKKERNLLRVQLTFRKLLEVVVFSQSGAILAA